MPVSIPEFLAGGLLQPGWIALAIYLLVATQLTIFAVTLYLHRSQAHRGVDFHPVVSHVFRFWSWLTTSMITREWVAIHRKHHAKCETAEDPHSPVVKGIGNVFWHRSEEHTSELQSLMRISYAVFCLIKKNSPSTNLFMFSSLTSFTCS